MQNWETVGVGVLLGSVLPIIISLILPRRPTVQFGRRIYKAMRLLLLQKRATFLGMPHSVWGGLLMVLRTSLTDLSFGLYIESREDFSSEEQDKKVDEYLNLHIKKEDTTTSPSNTQAT